MGLVRATSEKASGFAVVGSAPKRFSHGRNDNGARLTWPLYLGVRCSPARLRCPLKRTPSGPVSCSSRSCAVPSSRSASNDVLSVKGKACSPSAGCLRSEEHTSELQSRPHLVCRLLLEKKK